MTSLMTQKPGWPIAFLSLWTALMVTGCSRTAAPQPLPPQIAGDTTVTLTSGSLAHTGDNTLVVTLADAATGVPVGNANITATPEMLSPRLPGASTTGRSQGNGLYTIPVRLGVASRYNVALKVERPGKAAAEASFPVEAAQ